jgi:AcrR family transcriptional regulator
MIDDHRQRILTAAAHIYAHHGWRGATTRKIAEEAGVNEVTIFRQFGSKESLLGTAMRECALAPECMLLPAVSVNPQQELEEWVREHHTSLSGMRDIIRQMLSEAVERPESAQCAAAGPSGAYAQLQLFVVQLRRQGRLSQSHEARPSEVRGAVTMLMSAVFADAMNREIMPDMFPQSVEESLRAYVTIFLRGIGVNDQPAATPNTDAVRIEERITSFSQSTTE